MYSINMFGKLLVLTYILNCIKRPHSPNCN